MSSPAGRGAALAIAVVVVAASGCGKRDRGEARGLTAAPAPTPIAVTPADAWARCRGFLDRPQAAADPFVAVTSCGAVFGPRCQAALAAARPGLTVDDGLAVVRTCAAEACPLPGQRVCAQPLTLVDAKGGMAALVRAAVGDTAGVDPIELDVVGALLGHALLPVRAVVARLTVTGDARSIGLDGGGAWPVPAQATADQLAGFAAAAVAAGADVGGLVLWGWEGVPAPIGAAIRGALRRAQVTDLVYCRADGGNCR